MNEALKSALDWWSQVGVETPELNLPLTQENLITQTTTEKKVEIQKKPIKTNDRLQKDLKKIKNLDDLKIYMGDFESAALTDNSRQCVFSRGNPKANLMVIGDSPSSYDDKTGQPFVGPEGQLLDKMLASINQTEDNTYITTAINWKLPTHKKPSDEELNICIPFLKRHIELVSPAILLLVGGVSLQALTGLTTIMKNRGQWQKVNFSNKEIIALPIYHPTLLMKQPLLKREAWRDLCTLKEKLVNFSNRTS
ncbi:MAG: uracil-DNA glycosylase [Hellea sp.]|nr:uracil-DNA glycosylase [Hellea sp.]